MKSLFVTFNKQIKHSFKTFHKDSQNSNLIQRKRSYDVQSNNLDALPRRHSAARVHGQNFDPPIRKVINIICLAHEKSTTDIVRQNLDKALEILRSTELYSPAILDNDKHTNDFVSGLMSVSLIRIVKIRSPLNYSKLYNTFQRMDFREKSPRLQS